MARKQATEKQTTEQSKQAKDLANRIEAAKAQSKTAAADVEARLALSTEEEEHAQTFGKAIGQMSQARVGYAMTMRDMALYLAEPHFRMEGYAFDPNPKQKQFIRALFDYALIAAYGAGTKVTISSDQTLNNAKTGLNNLCKAYNLSGYLEVDGVPMDTVAHLKVILNRDPRPTNKDEAAGGWNVAVSKARDIIARARKQAETDEDLAKLIHGDSGEAKPRSNGRPRQPISQTRVDSIVADAPRLDPVHAEKIVSASLDRLGLDETAAVVDGLVKHLLDLVPVPSNTTPAKVSAKVEKARAWVQQHGAEFGETAIALVREARAAFIQAAPAEVSQSGKVQQVPAPTHTDEVTAARGRKRTARKVPTKVITETMQASA